MPLEEKCCALMSDGPQSKAWFFFCKWYLFRTFPIRGFQVYDGPVRLTRCTFKKFSPTVDRFSSAVGFSMKNAWQGSPQNNISAVKMERTVSTLGSSVSSVGWDRYRRWGEASRGRAGLKSAPLSPLLLSSRFGLGFFSHSFVKKMSL